MQYYSLLICALLWFTTGSQRRHFCLVHKPILLWTLCLPVYHCSPLSCKWTLHFCRRTGLLLYSSGSWKCPKTVSHPPVLKRPHHWSEMTGIYPYFIHSIPQLVKCFKTFKTFWKTVSINKFYKTSKIHLPYRKHIFSKNTYLIACIAYLKDSKSHSLRWHCNFHLLCRGNLKERWANQYFQSTFSHQALQKHSSLFIVPPSSGAGNGFEYQLRMFLAFPKKGLSLLYPFLFCLPQWELQTDSRLVEPPLCPVERNKPICTEKKQPAQHTDHALGSS